MNTVGRFTGMAIAVLLGGPAAAQVYKCTGVDGKASFGDQPCAARERAEVLVPQKAMPLSASPGASASGGTGTGPFGLTFALLPKGGPTAAPAQLACHGEPAVQDNPHRTSCNPYAGDTSCSAVLPVACFVSTGNVAPPGLKQDFYSGWTSGRLGATKPVRGDALKSEQAATSLCIAELGPGWRMAEFHDGGGGWGLQGDRGPNLAGGSRYWVRISDQRGNCWDRPR